MAAKDLVEYVARNLVDDPDAVVVEVSTGPDGTVIELHVAEEDMGKVIGRNGSGKSTLLKILSRITPPTTGRAVIRGRVGSLLEVGTGFHPELTGRENIFLNGAILGMRKKEIEQKFDQIVEFAGVAWLNLDWRAGHLT